MVNFSRSVRGTLLYENDDVRKIARERIWYIAYSNFKYIPKYLAINRNIPNNFMALKTPALDPTLSCRL